jgi:FkbM family methyltransferase
MDYTSRDVRVQHGDTVVDCGAHVGVFTRYALLHGAERVVAVEPDPTNIACLKANFQREISEGRVLLIKAGVWEKATHLTLTEAHGENSGAASFLAEKDDGTETRDVPAYPLDDIVTQLRLSRVDFIKMDIEGSERFALRGAGSTLRRFKPRMAISAYHLPDDPTVIPAISKSFVPAYKVHAKDVEFINWRLTPKVLFFDASPAHPERE